MDDTREPDAPQGDESPGATDAPETAGPDQVAEGPAEPTVPLPAALATPRVDQQPASDDAVQDPKADDGSGDGSDDAETDEDEGGGGRRWLTWLAVVAALIVVGVVGAVAYDAYSQEMAARAALEEALELVKDADETVLAVDEVVTGEITVGLAVAAEEASEQVEPAQEDIDEALGLLGGAYEDLDEDDQLVADALGDASTNRIAMLDEAPLLLDANARASRALTPAGDAMEELLAAEELSRQATTKFNLQTKEGVTAATELSTQAIEKLQSSRTLFRRAKKEFPEVDVRPFLDYIDAKVALIQTGIEIDELWLAGKISDANDLVEEYNEEDAKVAELAKALPESETLPIAEAYERVTADSTVAYLAARDLAARADTRLRDLLGTAATGTADATGTAAATTATGSADATGAAGAETDPMDEFWSHWAWPAATALIGLIFTVLLLRQWLQRRMPHQLAWTVGLLMYTVAAAMEAYSAFTGGWDPTVYRIYIVLAASLVGFLGLGSLYLVAKKRLWGDIFLGYLLVGIAIFLYGAFTTDLRVEYLVPGITAGGDPLGASMSFPRMMSFWFNIPGTIFLLGGALWSMIRFWPKPEYRYRVWANALIAGGTIVIAAAGGMARAGQTTGLYPAEMIASAMLLAGFLMAGTLEKGAKAIVEKRDAEKAEEPDTAVEETEPAG